jgi:hypothetical protein
MNPLGEKPVTKGEGSSILSYRPENTTIQTNQDLNHFNVQRPKPRELTMNFSNDPAIFREQLKELATTNKQVESLTLNFEKCEHLNDDFMRKLSKLLPERFSNLRSLTIIESLGSKLTANGYLKFATALKRLKSIEELNLSLKPRFKQPETALTEIIHSIKAIKDIKKLEIKIEDQRITSNGLGIQPNGHGLGDHLLQNLAESIQHHTGLAELNFFMSIAGVNQQISLDSVKSFAKALARLTSLEQLKLDFPNVNKLPENLNEILMVLKPLKSFSVLHLNFHQGQRSYPQAEVCHEALASIASLAHLTALHLNLGYELSVETRYEIANTIKKLEQLTSLGLTLRLTSTFVKVTESDQGCQAILASIARLEGLTKLDLCLYDADYGADKIITKLGETLHLRRHTLQALNLKLSEIIKLSDANLSAIARTLGNLQKLRNCGIELDLYCTQISEQGVSALTTSFGKVKSLTELALKVTGYHVTDKNLKHLGESLEQFADLTNLSLDFFQSQQLTPQGISHLADSFTNLTNLVEFNVKLIDSSKEVYEHGKTQITTVAGKLPKLKNLEVDVTSYEYMPNYG